MSISTIGRSHAWRGFAKCGATAIAITAIATVATPTSAQAWGFDNAEIARQAKSHPTGGHGGQCKVFVQQVVNEVLANHEVKPRVKGYGTAGGAYFGTYKNAGGVLIDTEAGRPGDLIQVITPAKRTSDFPPTRSRNGKSILHSAIIVDITDTPGKYVVRDSNYVATETIGTHNWTPSKWRNRGVEVYIWRFGVVPGVTDQPIEAKGVAVGSAMDTVLVGSFGPATEHSHDDDRILRAES